MADLNYFRLTSLYDGNVVKMVVYGTGWTVPYLEWSTNGVSWNEYAFGDELILSQGESILFRGDNPSGFSNSKSNYVKIESTLAFNASGNIMSLVDSSCQSTRIPNNYCFASLFANSRIVDASGLELPATTLNSYCYRYMFQGCTSLSAAPALPATTLNSYCYQGMFQGCTSLSAAPALPATTLNSYCYQGMFQGCTSLASAPALPATTLESTCYSSMFQGCTSLTSAPELPATTMKISCYKSMFQGCTSLASAPTLPATTLAQSCYYGMFNGCASLSAAPELPATTAAKGCYQDMFQECTALVEPPSDVPFETLAQQCCQNMFWKCSNMTSAPKFHFNGTASPSDNSQLFNIFADCSKITSVEIPWCGDYRNLFGNMFSNCTSLSSVTWRSNAFYTSATAQGSPQYWWMNGVPATGTFYYTDPDLDVESIPRTAYGVPAGWTIRYLAGSNPIKMFYINGLKAGSLFLNGNEVKLERPDYESMPLTFVAKQANSSVCLSAVGSPDPISLQYSIDEGTTWSSYTVGSTIGMPNVGSKVSFRCEGETGSFSSGWGTNKYQFVGTGSYSALGNLYSLIDRSMSTSSITNRTGLFYGVFGNNNSLVSARKLRLPATSINSNAVYFAMFSNCSRLEYGPEYLPATTLGENCYNNMFSGCSAMKCGPLQLPDWAGGGKINNWAWMFYNCENLVQAPELLITDVSTGFTTPFDHTFMGCARLRQLKVAFTAWPSPASWTYGMPATGTFYCPAALGTNETIQRGSSYCPNGWTVVNY